MPNKIKDKHDFYMKYNLIRLIYLILSLIFGFLLALIYSHFFQYIPYKPLINIFNSIGLKTISISLISLPTLTLLWYFRTYDTRDLIQKNEENINSSTLTNAINMFLSKNKNKKKIGKDLLIELRDNKKIYKDLINNVLKKAT
jgi:hypothetical protein